MAKEKEVKIDIKPRKINEKTLKGRDENNDGVTLYDLREDNYPSKRGDEFRSLQVFECGICGAITNSMLMGGYPGYGLRYYCPNGQEGWHKELKRMIKLSQQPHPKFYKEELNKETVEFKRKHHNDIKNDILGNPDNSLKKKGVWGED